ncbi:MAG: restriction endonuclease subunit S [Phycisphaerales bacterium]
MADAWTPTPLGSLLSLEYGTSLPEKDRSGSGFPVIGSNGLVGYHATATVQGPAIVVGRKGSVGAVNFIDSDCTPIDTTFYVELKQPEDHDFRFIWRLLEAARLDQSGDAGAIPGLNRNDVYRRIFGLPDQAEQRKIAECLSSLDDWISAETEALAALRRHKTGLMQQLFPRPGETQPRLRFPKFREESGWSKQRIGEVLVKKARAVALDPDTMYREIGVRSHGKGLFHKDAVRGSTLGTKRVFQVVADALVFNIVFAWERAVAVTTESERGFIASHRFPMFLPRSKRCDVRFMQRMFLTLAGKELLHIASPGGAGRNRTLSQSDLSNLHAVMPGLDEQRRIADCLALLDDLISTHVNRLEALQDHKRGLMQQLFPHTEARAK